MNRLDLSSGLDDPETWILKNLANDLKSLNFRVRNRSNYKLKV